MALLTGPTNCVPLATGWQIEVYKGDAPEGDPHAVYVLRSDGWYKDDTKVSESGQDELDARIAMIPPMDPPTSIPFATEPPTPTA